MTETESLKLTSSIAGTGMINSKYIVAVGCRKISSSMMAFTAPLAPFYETEERVVQIISLASNEYRIFDL